jgi:hypothetical protein
MKYKDKTTLLIQSKHQSKETNEYGFPFESDREIRRKRKKQLFEFWSKNLKGFLLEDFWNALDLSEKSSIIFKFHNNFDGSKEDFVKYIKQEYREKLQISRELTLKRLGIYD